MADQLVIRGAREHNLRNVSLELPRDKLIVFTGLSGSGKSSLAFDTIYAEGQRRYVESLSSYARQFLGQMDKPDVDFIEGLSPAISIDQKSRLAQPAVHGRHHHRGLRLPPPALRPHRRAALPQGRVGRHPADAPADRRPGPRAARGHPLPGAGARGARSQGQLRDAPRPTWPSRASPGRGSTARSTSSPTKLDLARYETHTIEVIVDRLVKREGIDRRLTESLETALELADGVAEVELVPKNGEGKPETLTFCQHLACPLCGTVLRGAGPPQLLVQLALRRLRDVRRPGHPLRGRPRAGRARPRPSASTRARSARGPAATCSTSASCSRPSPRPTTSTPTRRGRAPGQAAQAPPARRRGRQGRRHATRTATAAPATTPPPTRASCRGCSAATPRPSPTRSASRSRATCARCRAPRARAPASSRCRSAVTVDGHNIDELVHPVHRRRGRRAGLDRADRARPAHRRAGAEGDQRAAALPARRGARLPAPARGRRPRSPAARRSASAWPARSARAWSACSTSSTSRPSACTSATTTASSRPWSGCATSATPCSWSSTTRTPSGWPTTSSTSGPAPASTAARSSMPGPVKGLLAQRRTRSPGSTSSGKRSIPVPEHAARAGRCLARHQGRARAQPARHRRRVPARLLRGRHRRVGLGQVDAGQRHPAAGR